MLIVFEQNEKVFAIGIFFGRIDERFDIIVSCDGLEIGSHPNILIGNSMGQKHRVLHSKRVRLISSAILIAIPLIFGGCGEVVHTKPTTAPIKRIVDLPQIKARGKLIALCRYDPNNYFIYKGKPMGFEYEMLHLLADHLNLELQIRVPLSWNDVFKLLEKGEGDVVGASLSITLDRLKATTFTNHFRTTRQMLVQRKPKNWNKLKTHQIEKKLIRNPVDLIGQPVHVLKGSVHKKRLENLSEEVGGHIKIIEQPSSLDQGALIAQVAEGDIKHTIGDEELTIGYSAYYKNIDAKTPVSFPQRIAWAVRKDSPELLRVINDWIDVHRKTKNPMFNILHRKYFKNRKAIVERLSSEYLLSSTSGKLSPFDSLFKAYAPVVGWDWRMLASQAYQESRFNPKIKSWMGAVGLMQVLPATAKQFSITRLTDPSENVSAGVQYLRHVYKVWGDSVSEANKIKFTLASYNAGPGHVHDARRLAKKYGADPNQWEGNVAEYLLKKADKKFYYDEVVRYGYCRGSEPYKYVGEILKRYHIYKNFGKHIEPEKSNL